MPFQLSVVGSAEADPARRECAYEVGRLAAGRGWVVITGGLGGVMEAACRGASDAGGVTVGILPIYDFDAANPHVNVVIPTGLGHARNAVVVAAAHGVVAVGGGYGTLSEIALTLKLRKPVVAIGAWPGIDGVVYVTNAAEAISTLARLAERG